MLFLIKFGLTFLISFMILSLPIGKSTLFDLVHQHTAPYTNNFFSRSSNLVKETVSKSSEVGEKLFNIEVPDGAIEAQGRRAKEKIREALKDHDDYKDEERERIEKLIQVSTGG